MNKISQHNYLLYLFGGLLFIGGLLRFLGFWDWSLTNDELSAINRLHYDSLINLFKEGIWVDGHPAFVQLFLFYWTKLFGESVFALRLPFVLMGIGSIYYFYKLGELWINKSASLVALPLFASSQLLVLYSQISRPYVAGLFFVLAFTYYWAKVCLHPFKKSNYVGFVLMGLLASLTHYFSALSIALTLFVGLVIVQRKQLKAYILATIFIGILYIPHIPITLNHFSIGGVGWLAMPENDFIWRFLDYVFNNSLLLQLSLLSVLIIGMISRAMHLPFKRQLLLLYLFLTPYLIAYYYSIHKSPILQFSILIFSIPFLFLFIASFIKSTIHIRYLITLLVILTSFGLYSLVVERDFYQKKQFANFKDVALASIEWTNKHGKENVLSISNANNSGYLDYYLSKNDSAFQYNIRQISSDADIAKCRDIIQNSDKDYALIAFAGVPVPNAVHEYAKEYFSEELIKKRYFNSEAVLYKKNAQKRKYSFKSHYLENANDWKLSNGQLIDSLFYPGKDSIAFYFNATSEYACTYKDTVKNLFSSKYLTLSAWLYAKEMVDVLLVVSIDRDGKNIFWQGFNTKEYIHTSKWSRFIQVVEKKDDIKDDDLVTIYFWNNNRKELILDEFEITNFTDSDYNYYEFN